MTGRILLLTLLLAITPAVLGDECPDLDVNTDTYKEAFQAMSGHFPVPLAAIQYCGVMGWSKLFTASVAVYEKENGWEKSGSLRCWKFSQHKAGQPYGCGRDIISSHPESGIKVVSKHEIALETISQTVAALRPLLGDADVIEYINYPVIKCGGAWSISEHGFVVQVNSSNKKVGGRYSVKQSCSPTPCYWSVEKMVYNEPVR